MNLLTAKFDLGTLQKATAKTILIVENDHLIDHHNRSGLYLDSVFKLLGNNVF